MNLRHIGKKADLSLSINAIVVLILAITMLGLGLAFLRGTFSKTTAQFAQVADEVKGQIVDKIKASSEKLAFDRLEINVKRGNTVEVYYGVKNVEETLTPLDFSIQPTCNDALTPTTTPADTAAITAGIKTFSKINIKQGDVEVSKMTITPNSGAVLDTYSCWLYVCKSASGTCTATDPDFYASAKFFVTVTS